MDSAQAQSLKGVDPTELGHRIAAARRAKGLTQGELAGSEVSIGYVSRIEAGQRRPTAAVLETFAERLAVTVDELLLGVSTSEYDELRLALDYAELALESGQAGEAATRSAEVVDRATAPALVQLRERARYVAALAQESQGLLDDAILALEPLVDEASEPLLRLTAAVALSRCYRDAGDFARSIDVAERVMRRLADVGLENSDEAIQLAVTLAAAHFERGDSGQAVRVCRRAVERAEHLDSPRARASAYWNASVIQAERGAAAEAVQLAERALGLLRADETNRNFARLQAQLGIMQLKLDPPAIDEARRNLEQAAEMYRWSSAAPADLARNDMALARAQLMSGDLESALTLIERVRNQAAPDLALVHAEASSIEGRIRMMQGDAERARSAYQRAVALLTGVGADKSAAQLWFELAPMLEQAGDLAGALTAYRSAAAATGLRAPAVVPLPI